MSKNILVFFDFLYQKFIGLNFFTDDINLKKW